MRAAKRAGTRPGTHLNKWAHGARVRVCGRRSRTWSVQVWSLETGIGVRVVPWGVDEAGAGAWAGVILYPARMVVVVVPSLWTNTQNTDAGGAVRGRHRGRQWWRV